MKPGDEILIRAKLINVRERDNEATVGFDSTTTAVVPLGAVCGLEAENEIDLVRAVLCAHQTAYAKAHNGEGRDVIESDNIAIGYASVELAKLLAGREAGKLWRISQAVKLQNQNDLAGLQQFYDYVKGVVGEG